MATYFETHRTAVDLLPHDAAGLRRPQLGAAAALISHGTRSDEPAVVVLPTGTGKTAVLQLTPYLWEASRVLVVTPSRLVREQIAQNFQKLTLLTDLGVFPIGLPSPNVVAVGKQITSDEEWEELRMADVVVTTPMSASPSLANIPSPPVDLFDLVIVDEAHHTPATSYHALLDAFPDSRQALFTATPYRRDKRRVPGKMIYNYPLRDSIRDGTYGKIEYVPCIPQPGEDHDVAIAKATEAAFAEDAAKGLDHRLMVRTDSVERAKTLREIYQNETNLELQLVHGGHSLSHVTSVIKKLHEGTLNGLICVDMFGEGVDFPRLKIAALHAPHKSLAVTLQFIGRFARTNAGDIGSAKFIAVPQEIDAEVRSLYKGGASWEELVANLADARIEEEETIREGLATFHTEYSIDTGELDLTVESLRPYFHTKVFHVNKAPDLHADPIALPKCDVVYSSVSVELSSAIVVYRRLTKPKWLEVPSLVDIKNLLYVVHYNAEHGLLFINSVEKQEDLFEEIAGSLYANDLSAVYSPLPHETISRALRILNDPRFYNVGMRNRAIGNNDESYRTLTGPSADKNVSRSDGKMRSRGHVFGGGTDNGGDGGTATLGISTLSKVWSNRYGLVPEFVAWCSRLATELNNAHPVATGSNIDFLDTGKRVTNIPAQPIAAVWHEHVFKHPQIIRLEGTDDERDLTGLELVIDGGSYNGSALSLDLILDDQPVANYQFDISARPMFSRTGGSLIQVLNRVKDGTLEDFLNLRPPTLFLADFSTLVGDEWYRGGGGTSLDKQLIRTFGEFGSSVDIQREVSGARKGMLSVHEFTEQQFLAEEAEVVLYDHRTGEVADYLSLSEENDVVVCSLAHCKGAGGVKAGARVNDSYEVAGQIVKCLRYQDPHELLSKLTQRAASGSTFRRGNFDKMVRILTNAGKKRFEFRLRLVQPGISEAKLNDEVSSVLAAASDYVKTHTGFWPSFWISP